MSEQPDGDALEGIVGSVSERGLLDRAYRDPAIVDRTVGEVMDRPLPTLDVTATVDEAFALLSDGAAALLAVRDGRPAGVVSRLDLLEYLAHRPSFGSRRPGAQGAIIRPCTIPTPTPTTPSPRAPSTPAPSPTS